MQVRKKVQSLMEGLILHSGNIGDFMQLSVIAIVWKQAITKLFSTYKCKKKSLAQDYEIIHQVAFC